MKPSIVISQREPESPSQKASRKHLEAKRAASEHLEAVAVAIDEAVEELLAISVSEGIYPLGVRDIARRSAEDWKWKIQSLRKIMEVYR